jgi:hypothetical protein
VKETDTRIRVYLNDPEGRGDRLVDVAPPEKTESGPWGFRVDGRTPEPQAYEPDTLEFLHWQIASALDRGKRLWTRRPAGRLIPGPVLPAVAVAGEDLNAYYDRKALRFFRDVDTKTHAVVHSGDSPDIVTHEQGHAILDAIRPDLWDAPHFEVAAFHEAFGDLAAIFVALAEPVLAERALSETEETPRARISSRGWPKSSAKPSATTGAGRRAARRPARRGEHVRLYRSEGLPATPRHDLSAEPHSFCRVMTGACWDVLVAIFRATEDADRTAALARAAERTSALAVAAAQTAPSERTLRAFRAPRRARSPRGQ